MDLPDLTPSSRGCVVAAVGRVAQLSRGQAVVAFVVGGVSLQRAESLGGSAPMGVFVCSTNVAVSMKSFLPSTVALECLAASDATTTGVPGLATARVGSTASASLAQSLPLVPAFRSCWWLWLGRWLTPVSAVGYVVALPRLPRLVSLRHGPYASRLPPSYLLARSPLFAFDCSLARARGLGYVIGRCVERKREDEDFGGWLLILLECSGFDAFGRESAGWF